MIFRPYFWHSLGAFCIAEKRGDERSEGRIAADPSRTSSFWRFAVCLRQSERGRGGWLIGAAASKTKPTTASANFNECNQKNRFGRLSGPNGDRSRSTLTKEWVEIIRGQMSMRDQKLITPLRPRPSTSVRRSGSGSMVGPASALWSGERQDHSTYAGVSRRLYSSYGECGCQICSL